VLRAEIAYLDPEIRIDTANLAGYMRRAADAIHGQSATRILAGEFAWPCAPAGGGPQEPV
jgi:hypothetical protein